MGAFWMSHSDAFLLENPLGSKHIAEMFWIFKALALLFPVVFFSLAFFFFFTFLPLFYVGFFSFCCTLPIFLPACGSISSESLPASLFQSFSYSPDWCATNKFMLLPSKHCIPWEWEEKIISNKNLLKRTDFCVWVRRIKENLMLIS